MENHGGFRGVSWVGRLRDIVVGSMEGQVEVCVWSVGGVWETGGYLGRGMGMKVCGLCRAESVKGNIQWAYNMYV